LDVVNVESDEFAAAQCAGKADQYECSVSYVDQSVAEWCDERADCPQRPPAILPESWLIAPSKLAWKIATSSTLLAVTL
jgi:hypothetical protein